MDAHTPANNTGTWFEVRPIPAVHPDFRMALRRVFNLGPTVSCEPQTQRLLDVLGGAPGDEASLDFLLGAYDELRLVTACLALVSPGAAAMVMIPPCEARGEESAALLGLLRAVQSQAWKRSISLLELLVEAANSNIADILNAAGFHYLTRLVYLRQPVSDSYVNRNPEAGIEWVPYTTKTEPLFLGMLEQSYAQSLDCPELTGIRTTAEVLAGHRAAGLFDPALWWVAKRRGEPVGLILLNRIPRERGLEVVYMGVACPARGTGVADTLLGRAIELAARAGVNHVSLAVDCRNTPAHRVYRRWGFVQTGERDAWIVCAPQSKRD